jgi:hypothetical protein
VIGAALADGAALVIGVALALEPASVELATGAAFASPLATVVAELASGFAAKSATGELTAVVLGEAADGWQAAMFHNEARRVIHPSQPSACRTIRIPPSPREKERGIHSRPEGGPLSPCFHAFSAFRSAASHEE